MPLAARLMRQAYRPADLQVVRSKRQVAVCGAGVLWHWSCFRYLWFLGLAGGGGVVCAL